MHAAETTTPLTNNSCCTVTFVYS